MTECGRGCPATIMAKDEFVRINLKLGLAHAEEAELALQQQFRGHSTTCQ